MMDIILEVAIFLIQIAALIVLWCSTKRKEMKMLALFFTNNFISKLSDTL